jgi:hypothetical protein
MSFGTRPMGRAPLGSSEANYGGGGGGGSLVGYGYLTFPLMGVGSLLLAVVLWW